MCGIVRCGLCPAAIPQRISRLFLASTRPRRHRTNSNDFVQPFAMGANNEWSLSRRNACRRRRVQHRPAHRRLSVHRSSEPASCRPRALHHLDLSLGCGETFLAHASPQNFSCTIPPTISYVYRVNKSSSPACIAAYLVGGIASVV